LIEFSCYQFHLIPHVRDYPNQEYKAELCYKAPLCTPEAFVTKLRFVLLKLLLPTWTIYLLMVPNGSEALAGGGWHRIKRRGAPLPAKASTPTFFLRVATAVSPTQTGVAHQVKMDHLFVGGS